MTLSRFQRIKGVSFFVSLLIAIVSGLLYTTSLSNRFELLVHDTWYSLRGTRPAPQNLVVVAMDEISYRNLNIPLNQPWPRALHAKLIERLASLGAKRVIFDVLFYDQSSDPAADTALAKSLKAVPVVLGAESAIQQVGGAGGSFALEELLEPYAPLRNGAQSLGLVGLPDDSGFIRRFFTQKTERTREIPSLAEAAVELSPSDPHPDKDDFINYYGPAHEIQYVSYYQVLEEERPIAPELLKGKTVFVGLSLRTDVGPAQKDIYRNPFGGQNIFGVEVHATAAGNLLEGNWIRRSTQVTEILFISLCAAIISFVLLNSSPVSGGILILLWATGWSLVAYLGFTSDRFIPGALLSFIIFPLVFLVTTFQSFIVARRSEQKLRSAFELYVSPDMVAQLQKDDAGTRLGGQKVWATALFTDIERFTEIAEELPPERAAEMLNDYFTEVMDVIFRNKGTLIKFIGDAVFVIWGAPVHMDNHAERALTAAKELLETVERFNAVKKYPHLRTRIGINTGPMVVGNLGSKKRFDYTAIGDSVNLASRVEGLNKHFGTSILFTEAVRKDAGISTSAIPVGTIRVKGKREGTSIYTAFTPHINETGYKTLIEALRAFRKGLWEDADKLFAKAASEDTKLSGIETFYRNYIVRVSKDGTPLDWEGEIELDAK